jgi:hypothetical protein
MVGLFTLGLGGEVPMLSVLALPPPLASLDPPSGRVNKPDYLLVRDKPGWKGEQS